MRRIDLSGDSAHTAEQLVRLVTGATYVCIVSPWDDELGYVTHDDEPCPPIREDDIVVTLRREPEASDLAFACALAARFEEKVEAY